MKIDRMLFDRFEQKVKGDERIAVAVNEGKWGEVIDYVNQEVIDKPEDYYTLDKLRRTAAVDRRLTLREILEKVFGFIPRFKSKNELLDFMVAIVDPKKTETILDPACGTAGFLISAYKHILRANSSPLPSPRFAWERGRG